MYTKVQSDFFIPLKQCFLLQWRHTSTIQRRKRYLTVKNKSQLLPEASPSAAFISSTSSTPVHDSAGAFDVHRAALEQEGLVLERGPKAVLHIHTLVQPLRSDGLRAYSVHLPLLFTLFKQIFYF